MAGPEIKICGITTAEALEATIAARADYVGFNSFPPSPRHVAGPQLRMLATQAAGRIRRVGLFVNAEDSLVAKAVAAGSLDIFQLHGDETPERVAQLRARYGVPVWKVIPVASAADIEGAERYAGAADLILFDAKTPKDAALTGGMGLRFDWSLLRHYRGALPWGLAGGLTPENVADAVAQTGAPLVDTSSGVESAPGIKDAALIAAFCAAARGS